MERFENNATSWLLLVAVVVVVGRGQGDTSQETKARRVSFAHQKVHSSKSVKISPAKLSYFVKRLNNQLVYEKTTRSRDLIAAAPLSRQRPVSQLVSDIWPGQRLGPLGTFGQFMDPLTKRPSQYTSMTKGLPCSLSNHDNRRTSLRDIFRGQTHLWRNLSQTRAQVIFGFV